jgi:hypothetical protein
VTARPARSARPARWGRAVETALTVAVAGIATAVAVNGMWRVFGDTLHLNGWGRVLTAGFLELALLVSALRARRSLHEHGSVGVDGAAVWVIAVVSAVVSAADADGLAKAVRLAAPIVAAWLWERGLAADRRAVRQRRPVVIAWRWTRERLAVRLGLADPTERATSEVDRARRLAALTRARLRLAVLEASTLPWPLALATARPVRVAWATWRLQRQVLAAVEHLHLGTDPTVPQAIRATVAAVVGLRAATAPAALAGDSPWTAPAVESPRLPTSAAGQMPEGRDRSPATTGDTRPATTGDTRPDTARPTRPVTRGRPRPAGTSTAATVTRLAARHPDWSTQDIADRLGVSARTVRRHLANHRNRPSGAAGSAA